MSDQVSRANEFTKLHKQGDPLIIYNVWDGGSARAVEGAGAKAIATGDHPVGYAHGFTDDNFDDFTFDKYYTTIAEIADCITVPFSVDINNADDLTGEELKERIQTLLELGVVGINYEDRLPDSSGIQSIEEQMQRISTVREAAESFGVPLFINARTDLFMTSDKSHEELIDEAVVRSQKFREAGANGFFAPGLDNGLLIAELCQRVELPVNILSLPTAPSASELAKAGASRISYGPGVQTRMIEWLTGVATTALQGKD